MELVLERNGTGTNGEWPMENMRNGSRGNSMMVLFWMFLLLSGRACLLVFAVALRFRLPVADCGMVMACCSLSGKAGHGIVRSVLCITKRLARRFFHVALSPQDFRWEQLRFTLDSRSTLDL
jgi:hypothetical protein